MEKDDTRTAAGPLLAGPALVTIKIASPRGPLARKGESVSVPPTQIRIVDTGAIPQTITLLTVDPLQLADSGVATDSNLAAEAAQRDLVPGESALITISGQVPTVPALYTSTLRLTTEDGARLDIRVNFRVAANAAWGFGFMVLGLLFVWLINALDTETGIQGDLRHALVARKDVHELMQQTPPPQSRIALVNKLNAEFDAAIAILQRPRALSFVDRRPSDAKEHLDVAVQMTAELRKELFTAPRGSIEVADLEREWKKDRQDFATLSNRFFVPPPQGASLTQRLLAFDAWAAQRLLRVPVDYYTNEFDLYVNHTQLLYASGREQDAAAEAVAVRRWMQRAANVVNTQAQNMMHFTEVTAINLATDERVRRRLEAPEIAPDRRAAIRGLLDEASSLLVEPFDWSIRRTVNLRVENARTETLRAEKDATTAAMEVARAQEEKEDSIEGIDAVIAEGASLKRGADGKIDPQEKIKWLRRGVAAWRTRLATFPDPEPQAMRAELDGLEAAIDSGDLTAVSAHSKGLFEQWRIYSTARAQTMILKATAPFCLRMREDALFDMQTTQANMRRLAGHPRLLQWENELDGLRMKTDEAPDVIENMPLDCLTVLGDLSTKTFALSNEVNSALWDATKLPDTTKRRLAADLRESLTPETLQNLISDVRPLRIEVTTPPEERYVGREMEFRIANLDPVWGSGVMLSIDFNDGHRATASAEDLRKNKWFSHAYPEAKTFNPTITAAETLKPGTLEPIGKKLGDGLFPELTISSSPISTARHLGDIFFNARFGLALVIAALLYFWRYAAMKPVFGASPFDYAQAFALGFAVSLAVNNLPQKLAEFIK